MPVSDNLSPTPPKKIEEKNITPIDSHLKSRVSKSGIKPTQKEVSKAQNDTFENKVSKQNHKPLKTRGIGKVRDTLGQGIKTKSDRTRERVSKCYSNWVSKHGIKPTQKEVSKATDLSLITVKRYWSRVVDK